MLLGISEYNATITQYLFQSFRQRTLKIKITLINHVINGVLLEMSTHEFLGQVRDFND